MAETSAAPVMMPPDDLRCKKNDGKSWRCGGWRIHEKSYCEKHFLQSVEVNAKRKSLASPEASKGKAKGSVVSGSGTRGKRSGGLDVGKSRRVGSVGRSRNSKRRGRDGELSSPEEVLPAKKHRNVGNQEEKEKEQGKMKPEVERDEGSFEENKDRAVGEETISGIMSGLKKRKIKGTEENDDEEDEKNEKGKTENSDRNAQLGSEEKIAGTEVLNEDEDVNLDGESGDTVVERAKRKDPRTKSLRVTDKKNDEDKFETSEVDCDVKDVKGGKLVIGGDDGSKMKSQLKGKSKEVRRRKSVRESDNADADNDGSQEEEDVCLADLVKKERSPEVLSKRKNKKLQGNGAEFSNKVEEDEGKGESEQEAPSGSKSSALNRVVKKAKSSSVSKLDMKEQRRKNQKREDISETKEEEGDCPGEMKDSKTEVLSKRDKRKLKDKEGEVPNKVKVKKAQRGGKHEAENDKRVSSVGSVVNKAKNTLENKSKLDEQRSSKKKKAMSDTKDGDGDSSDELKDESYTSGERTSRQAIMSSKSRKVDRRRKHFSSDVSFT